jgi:hypothetical protein
MHILTLANNLPERGVASLAHLLLAVRAHVLAEGDLGVAHLAAFETHASGGVVRLHVCVV